MFKKVKKFVSEHKVECAIVGFGLVTGVVAGVYGYNVGYESGYGTGRIDENTFCCQDFGRKLRDFADNLVYVGQKSLIDAIEESECGKKVVELIENNPVPINTIPYVRSNPVYLGVIAEAELLMDSKSWR